MNQFYDLFIEAINGTCLVEIKVHTEEKGIIDRKCVPFDYGQSRRYKDGRDRFHFYDLNSPEGSHNLSILPENLLSLTKLEEGFNPADYVTWTPNWIISRDWGERS